MTESHDTRSREALVMAQFGATAATYVTSAVHAGGEDLDWIAGRAQAIAPAHALDLGCGGGHVAYRLAAHATRVTACDLSAEMIAVVGNEARARGFGNLATQVAAVEALPFPDGHFDMLACRFSAHHWRDFEGGLREARRVLAPGGTAIFVDVAAPEAAACDVHLQAVELLRDPSHLRDYRTSEWLAALGRAGFAARTMRTDRLRMDFASWTARMRTSETHKAAIRSLQAMASEEITRHFTIEADGSFTLDTIALETAAA